MERLFHIAREDDWLGAAREGAYRISTLGVTLAQRGYIHLCFGGQVRRVADRFDAEAGDLVLLEIDPARLTPPVVVESGEGTDELFPHLYGELSVDAVTTVRPYRADGALGFPAAG